MSYPTWRFKAKRSGKRRAPLKLITGNKHERLIEKLVDSSFISGDADNAVINKSIASSANEVGGSENVRNHHGL